MKLSLDDESVKALVAYRLQHAKDTFAEVQSITRKRVLQYCRKSVVLCLLLCCNWLTCETLNIQINKITVPHN